MDRIVNELGDIREQLELLHQREKVLKKKLVAARYLAHNTTKYSMTMRRYDRGTVDYEALVDYLKVSDMLKRRFTKITKVTEVRMKKNGR